MEIVSDLHFTMCQMLAICVTRSTQSNSIVWGPLALSIIRNEGSVDTCVNRDVRSVGDVNYSGCGKCSQCVLLGMWEALKPCVSRDVKCWCHILSVM